MRAAALALVLALVLVLEGCSSAPSPEWACDAAADEREPAATTVSAVPASVPAGSGVARDSAPPQRRYRLVSELGGGMAAFRMRVVPEPNVAAMPGVTPEPTIPEPPPVPAPPDPKERREIKIPAPR